MAAHLPVTTRRSFLQSAGLAAGLCCRGSACASEGTPPLQEFGYGRVELLYGSAQKQFEETQSVLCSLNEDSLLKPWRLRAGLPAPGPDLGGWYDEVPLDKTGSGGHGFAPAHSFGQWISALSRGYACSRDPATRAKLERLLALYGPAISGKFYVNFRFPAYNYDKMVIGLIDAGWFAGQTQARALLDRTTDAAEPHLPPHALDRDEPQRLWRKSIGDNTTNDYTWDESYTMPENLYLAWERGAGDRYRTLARRYLLDKTYFDPLSENKNVLPNHHAYSFCNALSSAMQAYLADGSQKHLRAASNAFDMISDTQSFATGGWGPNESFVTPGEGKLYDSLTDTHRGFETPCGSYAHFKLTRYLLRVTRDGRYGDSMERVLYNTVLGAKQLERDGHAFYYSDYHFGGGKVYFPDAWPCCSGTLPQVAADYHIMTYFHDADDIFVNLYLPSTLRWINQDGAELMLSQHGLYPFDGNITLHVGAKRPADFAIHLRIPAWSAQTDPIVTVNDEPVSAPIRAGFLTLRRRWNGNDRIHLALDLPMRLEAIDPQHPNVVALLRGPLVLFAMGEKAPPVSRNQLLSATRPPKQAGWQAQTASGPLTLQPFLRIADERYSPYMVVS
ncbi:MAG: beta-L-arabinofuranosidase domain-containing protein [Bryobacteraceae bacterium]